MARNNTSIKDIKAALKQQNESHLKEYRKQMAFLKLLKTEETEYRRMGKEILKREKAIQKEKKANDKKLLSISKQIEKITIKRDRILDRLEKKNGNRAKNENDIEEMDFEEFDMEEEFEQEEIEQGAESKPTFKGRKW